MPLGHGAGAHGPPQPQARTGPGPRAALFQRRCAAHRPGPLAGRGHGKKPSWIITGKRVERSWPRIRTRSMGRWPGTSAPCHPGTTLAPYRFITPGRRRSACPPPRLSTPRNRPISRRLFPLPSSFSGRGTPLAGGQPPPYRAAYEAALAKTPWRGAPMESGWQTYFRCFDLFNRSTRPFPLLRWRIINALIPAFMRYREQARKKKQHG